MAILVCGGAGYIGSHLVRRLCDEGEEVIVIDNLNTGHKAAVDKRARFIFGNIADQELMRKVFSEVSIEAVIHFAALTQVGESMVKPLEYYRNNVCATESLLEVMRDFKVKHMVFSSTAAVYGNPEDRMITEKTRTAPMNPYGESKLAMENMIRWMSNATGMTYIALRYFNVAGAQSDGTIGEDHRPESHIVPIAVKAALENREFRIFGNDYPTPDGTCIRDYVHVADLADAHYLALNALRDGHGSDVYNLGSGSGYSNGEIIKNVKEVTGTDFPVTYCERRPGDPPRLVAVSDKIRTDLGWKPLNESIKKIIQDAVNWHEKHPKGYED